MSLAVLHLVHLQSCCEFLSRQRPQNIFFICEQQKWYTHQLFLLQYMVQLQLCLLHMLHVRSINNKDERIHASKIVLPVVPNRLLTPNVPNTKLQSSTVRVLMLKPCVGIVFAVPPSLSFLRMRVLLALPSPRITILLPLREGFSLKKWSRRPIWGEGDGGQDWGPIRHFIRPGKQRKATSSLVAQRGDGAYYELRAWMQEKSKAKQSKRRKKKTKRQGTAWVNGGHW
ncbi:uncharacterized protein Tco025E_06595 [Trypanosoma conorhini]|uniref:Uncharacterized protein n=1 Tax=Trypanosoma conorhini TaxID=83891 RepID=A0A3R7N2Q7_9TRYP|nr:uncharacterized protein Tco025E_06595 [Trypanosoma conorhini]RNF11890.1 hypothetical protein Tco025E_06595 [Trypanosoma conorhini]